MEAKEIIQVMKERMNSLKITNYDISKSSGISQSSLSRYFNFKSDMTLSVMLKIFKALELDYVVLPIENLKSEESNSRNNKKGLAGKVVDRINKSTKN